MSPFNCSPVIAENEFRKFSEMEKMEEENLLQSYSEDEAVLVKKIKDLIDTYVKPAVEHR